MNKAINFNITNIDELDEFYNVSAELGESETFFIFTIDKENREWGFAEHDSFVKTENAARLLNVDAKKFWSIVEPILNGAISEDIS